MRVISSASGLVPVHIGEREPGSEQEPVRSGYGRQRSPRVPGGLDWQKHGLQPRWLGTETSDCAVAVQPGSFHNRGADERDRFLAGARRRGELALVVAMIGEVDDDSPRSALSHFDSSVSLSTMFTSVNGRASPQEHVPTLHRTWALPIAIWRCGCSPGRRTPRGGASTSAARTWNGPAASELSTTKQRGNCSPSLSTP